MDIIKHRKIFFFISWILILASVAIMAVFGFRTGIDFVGGTLWQVKVGGNASQTNIDTLRGFFENELGEKNAVIYSQESGNNFLIRFGHISEEKHQDYLQKLKVKFGAVEEVGYETIGPTVGRELRNKSFWAVVLVIVGISLYVAYAFRKVSYPIKSWKYGIITLITLFHDVVISSGLVAFLGWQAGIEFDTKFIVALLVIMGFSVHDTIVVFDRIRENLLLAAGRLNLEGVINSSINQTMARSINTSLTLVLVLLALFFFGPDSLKYFVFVIMVGTIIGTYSSIFIASPALLLARSKSR